jgi:arabinan endo-1,5-alpha-L-arabinosidase
MSLCRIGMRAGAAVVLVACAAAFNARPAHASVTFYNLKAAHSGMCAELGRESYYSDRKTLIQGSACGVEEYRLFAFALTADGHWLLKTPDNRCMEVEDGSLVVKAHIVKASCNLDDWKQQWWINDAGSGYVEIANRRSELCLDVQGDYLTVGAYIWQYTCDGGDNQRFLPA